ncbi:MAG: hypothetical protein J3R72DRAFT_443577 [Linnemannia gamsii]|nr:MAG: hypothetical protein J3R72DRAFT_443577 [Linnemannia gamsii]
MSKEWQCHGCTLREIHDRLGFPCEATLSNGKTFSGHLYNVDPETFTLLILQLPPPAPPLQERSLEQAKEADKDTTVAKYEQESEVTVDELQQQQPRSENVEERQDQEPTQTQARVPPSTTQPLSVNATVISNDNKRITRPTMVAIRQHALKALFIDTTGTAENRLTIETMETLAGLPAPPKISPVDIESRKQCIITMLQSQRIPFKNDNEGEEVIHLLVGGASIKPPYTTSSVHCSNKVILERVQGMIREYDFNNHQEKSSPC